MNVIDFAIWLKDQLDQRDISQAELSRRSGLSPSQVSKILNMHSPPGRKALEAIASTLRIPPETIFRAAGLLPPQEQGVATLEEVNYKLSLLPPDQQQQVLVFVEFLLERGGRDATAPDTDRSLAPSRR